MFRTDTRGLSFKDLWPKMCMFGELKSANGLFLSVAVSVCRSNIILISINCTY